MDAHDELMTLADEYWESVLEASPSMATLLGDRRFDDRIEDLSAEAEDRLRQDWTELASRVDALDAATLSPDDQVTRSLLRNELARGVERLALRLTELSSDQMDGVHALLLAFAPQINAPTPENAAALVDRFRQVGTMLDQALDRFRAGLAAGRTPARRSIERSLNTLTEYLGSPLAEDPFVNTDGPEGWDGEAAWRDQLRQVTSEVIRPALQRYHDVLQSELLPAARPDDRCGLRWLDGGDELYRAMMGSYTTLDDLEPDEIHELGLAELERLRGEYAEIGERLWGLTDQSEIFARLRSDQELRYSDADQILSDVRSCIDRALAAMGSWFGRLPQAPCEVAPVPEFLAADSPGAYYVPPAADGSRPGTYFVNLTEPTERYRHEVAAVAFHEAIPGHHLQLAIASELDHLPRFQRFSFGNTAFVEGWALYAERLAEEMGLYTDDLERLGMLSADSFRSSRLVVDTGLHAKGWDRQQAIDFMLANVPMPEVELVVEVDRYVAIPAQALSYKVGQLEIQRLRRSAEASGKGSGHGRFDIKAFHDVVLGSGSVSLPVLRELVSR